MIRAITLLLLVCALRGGVAFAQAAAPVIAPDNATREAAKRYASGAQHYNLAEYVESLADFKAAYRLVPDAAFLFDIGQAHRLLGESEEAVQAYRAWLRLSPRVTAARRAAIDKFIADVEAMVLARAAGAGGPNGVDPSTARDGKPVYKRWWFWTVAGVVVGAGAAAAIAVPLAGRPEDPLPGTLDTVKAN